MSIRRRRIGPPERIDNKSPKDWDLGYEVVVSFVYGLNEDEISRVAGLRNYDTGMTISGKGAGVRDLMFPCGIDPYLAYAAANRLRGADRFGALRIKISGPVIHEGKDSYTPWYDGAGKLLERVKHRRKAAQIVKATFGTANARSKARKRRAGGKQKA